eukprot:COSAG04_NODE_71_length_29147_cov_8.406018_8_plen_165_part_00
MVTCTRHVRGSPSLLPSLATPPAVGASSPPPPRSPYPRTAGTWRLPWRHPRPLALPPRDGTSRSPVRTRLLLEECKPDASNDRASHLRMVGNPLRQPLRRDLGAPQAWVKDAVLPRRGLGGPYIREKAVGCAAAGARRVARRRQENCCTYLLCCTSLDPAQGHH